ALRDAAEAEKQLRRLEELRTDDADQSPEAKKRRAEAEQLLKDSQDAIDRVQQIQAEIEASVGKNADSGLRVQAARVKNALRANGLSDPLVRDRMEQVKKELDELAGNELPNIEERLTAEHKQAELQDPAAWERHKAELKKEAEAAEREADKAEAK